MATQAARLQNLLIILGPPAVGKTSVSEHLATELGYKVLGDGDVPDFVKKWFRTSDTSFWPLVSKVRREIFEGIASSYLKGLIVEYTWDFDQDSDRRYVESIIKLFEGYLWHVRFVELEASIGSRLARKREQVLQIESQIKDPELLDGQIMESADFMYNSSGTFPLEYPHLKIDSTDLSIKETVSQLLDMLK